MTPKQAPVQWPREFLPVLSCQHKCINTDSFLSCTLVACSLNTPDHAKSEVICNKGLFALYVIFQYFVVGSGIDYTSLRSLELRFLMKGFRAYRFSRTRSFINKALYKRGEIGFCILLPIIRHCDLRRHQHGVEEPEMNPHLVGAASCPPD